MLTIHAEVQIRLGNGHSPQNQVEVRAKEHSPEAGRASEPSMRLGDGDARVSGLRCEFRYSHGQCSSVEVEDRGVKTGTRRSTTKVYKEGGPQNRRRQAPVSKKSRHVSRGKDGVRGII